MSAAHINTGYVKEGNAVNDLITAVEKEDKDRNIRTLDTSRAEQRKFKKFSGAPGEDFLYFKKDLHSIRQLYFLRNKDV